MSYLQGIAMQVSEAIWLALIPQLGALVLLLVQQRKQKEAQDYQAVQIDKIKHQVEPNSGKSMADAVRRIDGTLRDVDTQLRSLQHSGKRHVHILTEHLRDVETEHEHDVQRLINHTKRVLEAHATTCHICKTLLNDFKE